MSSPTAEEICERLVKRIFGNPIIENSCRGLYVEENGRQCT